MSGSTSNPIGVYLPPLAFLPPITAMMDEMIAVLRRALEPAGHYRRLRADRANDMELAVLLFGLNALVAARAFRSLAAIDYGNAWMPHARTLYEVLVKIRWMRLDPQRATNFLDSEPFERFALATARVRTSHVWPNIVRDCEHAVAANPSLAALPDGTRADGTHNFKRIADGLRMPDLRTMSNAVGMDEDDYLLGQAITSLMPHSGIMHLKDFVKGTNADGTFVLSEEAIPTMLLSYAANALPRIGQITHEVLVSFPNGAVQFDTENLAARLQELVDQVRRQFGPPAP